MNLILVEQLRVISHVGLGNFFLGMKFTQVPLCCLLVLFLISAYFGQL